MFRRDAWFVPYFNFLSGGVSTFVSLARVCISRFHSIPLLHRNAFPWYCSRLTVNCIFPDQEAHEEIAIVHVTRLETVVGWGPTEVPEGFSYAQSQYLRYGYGYFLWTLLEFLLSFGHQSDSLCVRAYHGLSLHGLYCICSCIWSASDFWNGHSQ
jgi:hypothetical protein